MCLSKICAFFRKSKRSTVVEDTQVQESRQKGFEQSLEEVLRMTISIDEKEYLKAKELLQFMGMEIEGVKQDYELWEELQGTLVPYRLEKIKDPNNGWTLHLYKGVLKNNVDNNIHYAFNESVVDFLRERYTNPQDVQLIEIIETAYKRLKKS